MSDKTIKIIIYTMVILLGAFVFFIFFNQRVSPGTTKYYNGYDTFEVEQVDSGHGPTYKLKVFLNNNKDPSYIYTRVSPQDTENLNFERNLSSKVLGKKQVYVTIDPYANLTGETTLAALEIDKMIDNRYLFNIPVNSAFTKPYQNMTVKTCADADMNTSIIVLQTGPDTRAYSDGGCVILQGQTQSDIVKLADGLLFRMLNIVRS
jgi:hypothetical protein